MSNDSRRVRFRKVVGPPPASGFVSGGTLAAASLAIIPLGPGASVDVGSIISPDVSQSAALLPRT